MPLLTLGDYKLLLVIITIIIIIIKNSFEKKCLEI